MSWFNAIAASTLTGSCSLSFNNRWRNTSPHFWRLVSFLNLILKGHYQPMRIKCVVTYVEQFCNTQHARALMYPLSFENEGRMNSTTSCSIWSLNGFFFINASATDPIICKTPSVSRGPHSDPPNLFIQKSIVVWSTCLRFEHAVWRTVWAAKI